MGMCSPDAKRSTRNPRNLNRQRCLLLTNVRQLLSSDLLRRLSSTFLVHHPEKPTVVAKPCLCIQLYQHPSITFRTQMNRFEGFVFFI